MKWKNHTKNLNRTEEIQSHINLQAKNRERERWKKQRDKCCTNKIRFISKAIPILRSQWTNVPSFSLINQAYLKYLWGIFCNILWDIEHIPLCLNVKLFSRVDTSISIENEWKAAESESVWDSVGKNERTNQIKLFWFDI